MLKTKLYLVTAILGMLALVAGACAQPALTPAPTPTPSDEPSETETPTTTPAPALTGTLELLVTDAPPRENVTSIMVTVAEVQVHIASAEQEQEQEQEQSSSDNQTQEQELEQEQQQTQQGEGKWITIDLSANATTFDLLLIEGIERFLGTSEVDAGKYTQVRLVVETVQVRIGSGALQDATVPSKALKIVHPFKIVGGETTALVIDFDADKMVTVTGSGKITVKPVVKLLTKQVSSTGKPKEIEEEKDEELEFEGTIEHIDGSTWTMTIDGETRLVDVSGAEIEGEPVEGARAEVEGVVVGDTIIASEVKIKEVEEEEVDEEEEEEESVNHESIEVSCDEFINIKHITKEVEVNAGDSFKVTLCSNPTTGFEWSESAQIGDQTVMEQVKHRFAAPKNKQLAGAAGQEIWTFRALKEGTTTISMEYSQPWEGGTKVEWTFELTVVVK